MIGKGVIFMMVAIGVVTTVCGRDFNANAYGAEAKEGLNNMAAIQKAIDAAAAVGGGVVRFEPGVYESGALFLKSGVDLHLDEKVVIKAIQDDALYPERPTRVAGFEMVWPTALVNVYRQKDVTISGKGVIDGNGTYWWHKFWGEDGKSGMLKDYKARGLRWAVDYDCKRVRALAVYDSKDIEIRDVTIKRGIPVVRNIEISDVRATGAKRAIHANAYPEKPMRGIRLKNVTVEAQAPGRISNAADWSFEDVRFKFVEAKPVELKNCDGVHPPEPEPEPLGAQAWERSRQRVEETDKEAVRLGVGVDSKDE